MTVKVKKKLTPKIKEIHTRARISMRLDRLRLGNFGDCKTLQEGVSELRIHYGPGIRIYFGRVGKKIVLLLCDGDRNSQISDINRAKYYHLRGLGDVKK